MQNDQRRQKYKEFLVEGKYTALEYVKAISHTVGSFIETNDSDSSSEDKDDDSSVSTLAHNITTTNMCVVCLMSHELHGYLCRVSMQIVATQSLSVVLRSKMLFRYSQIDLLFFYI